MELVVEHLLTSIGPWIPFSAWSLEAQILLVCFCSTQSPPPPQALFPPPWVLSFLSPAKDQQVTDIFTTYTLESWPDTFNYIL